MKPEILALLVVAVFAIGAIVIFVSLHRKGRRKTEERQRRIRHYEPTPIARRPQPKVMATPSPARSVAMPQRHQRSGSTTPAVARNETPPTSSGDSSGSSLVSGLVGYHANSTLLGTLAGGDPIAAAIGDALRPDEDPSGTSDQCVRPIEADTTVRRESAPAVAACVSVEAEAEAEPEAAAETADADSSDSNDSGGSSE